MLLDYIVQGMRVLCMCIIMWFELHNILEDSIRFLPFWCYAIGGDKILFIMNLYIFMSQQSYSYRKRIHVK